MREFIVTAEMKEDANSSRQMMMQLRDEMERAGFHFKDVDSYDLVEPSDAVTRPDGTTIFRQWERH